MNRQHSPTNPHTVTSKNSRNLDIESRFSENSESNKRDEDTTVSREQGDNRSLLLESLEPLLDACDGTNWDVSFLNETHENSGESSLPTAVSTTTNTTAENTSSFMLSTHEHQHIENNEVSNNNDDQTSSTQTLTNSLHQHATSYNNGVPNSSSVNRSTNESQRVASSSQRSALDSSLSEITTRQHYDVSSDGDDDTNTDPSSSSFYRPRNRTRGFPRFKWKRWNPWEEKILIDNIQKFGCCRWIEIADAVGCTLKQGYHHWFTLAKSLIELDQSDEEGPDDCWWSPRMQTAKKRKRVFSITEFKQIHIDKIVPKQNYGLRRGSKRPRRSPLITPSSPQRKEQLARYARRVKRTSQVPMAFLSLLPLPYQGPPPALPLRDPTFFELSNTLPSHTIHCVNWDKWFINSETALSVPSSYHSSMVSSSSLSSQSSDIANQEATRDYTQSSQQQNHDHSCQMNSSISSTSLTTSISFPSHICRQTIL